MTKAIFIDKDGTLIKNIAYNVDPHLISLEKKVIEGLKLFDKHGFKKIIVSNQPGVALGYYGLNDLEKVNERIQDILNAHDIYIDAFYYCPHHPFGKVNQFATECHCRKPLPGLIKRAALDHNINLRDSWMIGDILNDVEAGRRAGCSTVLVDNGGEDEWILNSQRIPHHVADNFYEAANIICRSLNKKHERMETM